MEPPPTAQKRKKPEEDEVLAVEHLRQQVASLGQALAAVTERFELRCKGRANCLKDTAVYEL